jgi:monoamine oxidase
MSADVDIVIVGAGAAGLSAAKEAVRRGLSVEVIEASHRIGGRAYSEAIAPGVYFDLGCSYLHQGETNPFGPIADELGFTLGREFGDLFEWGKPALWRNGVRRGGDDAQAYWRYEEECFEAAKRAVASGADVAITDYVDLESEEAALYLYSMASLNAADPDRTSALDFLDAGGGADYPIREGFGNLVARWGADVPVSLNTRAQRIDWNGALVRVETPKGVVRGRSALVTVSTGVLAAGDIAFGPELPQWKAEAVAALPTDCANKIAIHFDRDVFGPEGRGFHYTEVGEGEPCGFEVSPFGDPLAVLFLGGSFGEWLEKQGERVARDYAISQVASAFGNDIRARVTRCIVTAWVADPWTRGAYSSVLPGQAHQRAELARPLDGRVFFAGEATIKRHQATCHGAYLSGIRAVEEIAAALASG